MEQEKKAKLAGDQPENKEDKVNANAWEFMRCQVSNSGYDDGKESNSDRSRKSSTSKKDNSIEDPQNLQLEKKSSQGEQEEEKRVIQNEIVK